MTTLDDWFVATNDKTDGWNQAIGFAHRLSEQTYQVIVDIRQDGIIVWGRNGQAKLFYWGKKK